MTDRDVAATGELKSAAVAEFNKKVSEFDPGGERNMNIYLAMQILWDLWKRLEQSWSCLIRGEAAADA